MKLLWGQSPKSDKNDDSEWRCRFFRVGVGQSHRCEAKVGSDMLHVVWRAGLIKRERMFHARNILRADFDDDEKDSGAPSANAQVTVHILTAPDGNGESEYKQYKLFQFEGGGAAARALFLATNRLAATVNSLPPGGRCLVFVNPISGTRSGPKRWKQVEALFALAGVQCDVLVTTHHGHAFQVVS
eukprot:CAMPEP_0113709528 /NCGR_PEP_ID=MMETSP0038_2-20120614/29623_1 /TAXON_ID=2898 /ORGANISM="Cryptomonas paramecium" /LENGTH=185 /DNA_ID=CAMNT_0000635427 /DNA_START=70 /DNA_END=623 /DNA_ORIENTATION=+ /assembly_acc=CAM_ASM_000170